MFWVITLKKIAIDKARMNNLSITQATKTDYEKLKSIMLLALKEDPKGFSSSVEEYMKNSEFWWSSYLNAYLLGDKDIMLLAMQENKIVGMSGIVFNSQERKKHVALVSWVYTIKENRGNGIAKRLMNEILDIATKRGIEKLTLMVNSSQKEALNMYKKFGFKHAGTLEKDLKIDGEYLDTEIMELNLNS